MACPMHLSADQCQTVPRHIKSNLPLKTNAVEDIRDTNATRYKCVVHHCTSYRHIPVARSILTPASSWWFIAHSHVISADPFSLSFQNSIQNRKGACTLTVL
ncbi:D-galactonate dehydratase [Fusarium oxysporum f. sp. albedinis]|nr:D-galactonate dehydratase [Fusarium oxysporum f. sp. albedinis]